MKRRRALATLRGVDGWRVFANRNGGGLYHPLVAAHCRATFRQFFQLRIYDKDLQDVDIRGAPAGSPPFPNVRRGDADCRAEDPR